MCEAGRVDSDTWGVELARGRSWVWGLFVLPLVLVGVTAAYGAVIFDSLPHTLPTHWGVSGHPDAWGDRSFGTVFGPLLIAVGVTVVLAVATLAVPLSMSRGGVADGLPDAGEGWSAVRDGWPDAGDGWSAVRREGMVRGMVAAGGLIATVVSALVCAICVVSWRSAEMLPPWIFWVFFALLAVMMWGALACGNRWARRRCASLGLTPIAEETQADELWVAGVLYNNPEDSQILVPKRDGVGYTVNIGSVGGRWMVFGFVAALVVLAVLGSLG